MLKDYEEGWIFPNPRAKWLSKEYEVNYLKMFNNMHSGFFDDPGITGMPKDWVFSELIMDLRNDSPREVMPHCLENITFGEYKGDISRLKKAVNEVDEDWVQYFGEWSRIFCAFDKDEVVAFCILSDLGTQDNLKIGGPGCVGTIPKYREKGIGLEMVRRATVLLKKEKYDISWIHYTHIENWYKKLGYETVLKWNSDGIVMEKQHEE